MNEGLTMNKNKVLALSLSLAVLAFAPLATLAQAPELFQPVTGSEEAIVRAKNEYFLKKTLYFAKRHRIVRVNAALLLKDGDAPREVTVNLFDDIRLRYEVTQLIDSSVGENSFRAYLADPPISADDLKRENSGLSDAGATELLDDIYLLMIGGAEFVHDTVRDRYWSTSIVNEYYSRTRSGALPKLPATAEKFYAFETELSSPDFTERYVLEPLYADMPYHLVWEVDSSKSFVNPDDPAAEAAWSENLKREHADKRRAYSEYLMANGIGDDPRLAREHKDLRAFLDSLHDR